MICCIVFSQSEKGEGSIVFSQNNVYLDISFEGSIVFSKKQGLSKIHLIGNGRLLKKF